MMIRRREDLPDFLRRAFDEDDRVRSEAEASDLRIAELQAQCRRQRGELVHKVYDQAERSQPQQRVADISAEAQKRWDAWADAKIDRALFNFLKGHLKETIGALISELRREWRGEIKKAITDFKLPVLQGWTPRFYNKGSIVLAGGGVYQAREDTAFHPGHSSWSCIAACGEPGQDGMGAAELNARLEKRLAGLELKLGALIVDHAFDERDRVVDLPKWPRKHNAG